MLKVSWYRHMEASLRKFSSLLAGSYDLRSVILELLVLWLHLYLVCFGRLDERFEALQQGMNLASNANIPIDPAICLAAVGTYIMKILM